ncbi:hypothetical protein MFUR16E_04370 [Methylobacterium fujisawaense]|uniref:hypothetical protein n=1 Tax=Methylobacterium fujisawaense TaxID=107400 RepID=UPI002F3289ED
MSAAVQHSAQTAILLRALAGEPRPATARGQALWRCRQIRAHREWIRRGCYAWWIWTGDLKAAQRQLLALRIAGVRA